MHTNRGPLDCRSLPYIEDLADCVRTRWRAEGFNEAAFPQVAADALSSRPLPDDFNLSQALNWGLAAPLLPRQIFHDFGQPPLTLHYDERFYIDVYVWRESTTAIHDHCFSGAFCVLDGSSLEATYRFETSDDVTSSFRLGKLQLTGCATHRRGDVRPITSGPGMIHAVFHLDHPSATLCVRSVYDISNPVQFEYFPPGVATHSFYEKHRPGFQRKCQLIEAGYALDDRTAIARASDIVYESDWLESFQIVRQVASGHGWKRARPLLEALADRDAGRARHVEAALREQERRRGIISLRKTVRNEDQRFLLALLANLSDRATILARLAERFPGADPAHKLGELYTGAARLAMDDSGNPLSRIHQFTGMAIGHLLHGVPADEVATLVKRSADEQGIPAETEAIALAAQSVHHVEWLKPLFSGVGRAA